MGSVKKIVNKKYEISLYWKHVCVLNKSFWHLFFVFKFFEKLIYLVFDNYLFNFLFLRSLTLKNNFFLNFFFFFKFFFFFFFWGSSFFLKKNKWTVFITNFFFNRKKMVIKNNSYKIFFFNKKSNINYNFNSFF